MFVLVLLPFQSVVSSGNERQGTAAVQKPLQHAVGVTLKLIQVVVLDKRGNPVADLKKEDFILTDNGQKMTLTEFEKHALPLTPVKEKVEVRVAPTPAPAKPALLNRKIFLFFNFGYSSGRGIREAREEALKYIDTSLLPSDEVAVVTYSLFDRLKVREFLTTDHDKARKAVEGIGLADAIGTVEDPDVREARLLGAYQGGRARALSVAPPGEDIQALLQARMYVAHLTSFAQALRYTPGQKILVMFTMGIDGRILYSGTGFSELRNGYEDLCSEFATANIAVYPIDTTDQGSAEYNLAESVRGISALRRMAQETGGEYLGHVDASEAHFEKIQKMTGTYYVLGYPITEVRDGKPHKIVVKVNRPDCDVRAQAGYLNPKPFSAFTKIERELHLVDLALSDRPLGQVPIRFPLVAIPWGTGRDAGIWLVGELPLRELREKWTGGPVEILGLAYDLNDEQEAVTKSEIRPAARREDAICLAARIAAPSGSYRCRIVARDLDTGAAAVGAASATISAPAPGVRLLAPLFLRPDRGARYIHLGTPGGTGKEAAAKALAEALGFDPAQYAPYFGAKLLRGSEIWAAVPCEGPVGFGKGTALTAKLLDKLTNSEIPVPLTVLNKVERGGAIIFFVRLIIPEVEPDEYGLAIAAEGAGAAVTIMRDFIIE